MPVPDGHGAFPDWYLVHASSLLGPVARVDSPLADYRLHGDNAYGMGDGRLDLAYVAAGRYDGYWERELQPWDIAAGILLVKEAGGMVAPIREGYDILEKGALLCSNDPLFEPFKKIIRDE